MRRYTLVLVALLIAVLSPASADTLRTRTFVSSTGNDSGSCAPATPCRTFAYAVTQTAPAGELVALDTAGFGPVTITQSISIMAVPGALASIAAESSVEADVVIKAGPSDSILLRNILFDTTGTQDGINFYTGETLHVEDCTFTNFTEWALVVAHYPGAADEVHAFIEGTTFRDVRHCLYASAPLGYKVFVLIDRSSFTNGSDGFDASDNCRAVVRDSVFSNLDNFAVSAGAVSGTIPAEVLIERTSISNCHTGVIATGTVRISDSSIIDNGVGLQGVAILGRQQGTVGTNTVEGNASGNDFTAHYASK